MFVAAPAAANIWQHNDELIEQLRKELDKKQESSPIEDENKKQQDEEIDSLLNRINQLQEANNALQNFKDADEQKKKLNEEIQQEIKKFKSGLWKTLWWPNQ